MAARLTAYLVVVIVGATLIAGLLVGAQRDDNEGPVDLIVHNAKVYTAGPDGDTVEALAIRGNQILQVGTDRQINRLRRPQTVVIDAQGAAVLPGFNDAHLRLIEGGLAADQIDLAGATDLDAIKQTIVAWSDANPDSPWVLGRGWTTPSFPRGAPTRHTLDALVPDRPARLISRDGRSAWVNSVALELAGITAATANPPNGTIIRDARTGEPTGLLKDGAMALLQPHLPAPTPADSAAALRTAIRSAHRRGITSVQDARASIDEFGLYAEARRAGDLDLRVYAALLAPGVLTESSIADLDRLSTTYPDDPLFKAGAIAIRLDGQAHTRTAALLEPYADEVVLGATTIAPDDLNRMVRLLDARGWQISIEARGDRAVRMTLDAYAHAERSNPRPTRARRHRISGADLVDADDLARFATLNVAAVMQPLLPTELEPWLRNLGTERAQRVWDYTTMNRLKGGHLAFASNWPAQPLDPLRGLHAAVSPAPTLDATIATARPRAATRLTIEQAVNAYTYGSAWASFDEERKGTLEPGMLADLVLLSSDIFVNPTSRLRSARVKMTIFDGKIVFRSDGGETD